MRLLHVKTYRFKEFLGCAVEPHAVFSHTWSTETSDEVTYGDMLKPEVAATKLGFRKIEHCCRQAEEDGLKWVWIDTCCIDKTSSTELSEAINSMFRWYRDATICYAYLSDMGSVEQLELLASRRTSRRAPSIKSSPGDKIGRWFYRSWTLQELLAPRDVRFFGAPWQYLGTKDSLKSTISAITGISEDILCHQTDFFKVPAATRMHWASRREASRIEDEAYSLLGIFDVNMPLLYGEGEKAFQRLQHKILKQSEDCTLLLWNSDASRDLISWDDKTVWEPQPILAKSPADFKAKPGFAPVPPGHFRDFKMTTPERGLRMNILKAHDLSHAGSASSLFDRSNPEGPGKLYLGLLNCAVQSQQRDERDDRAFVAIVLRPRSILDKSYRDIYVRLGPGFFVIAKSDFMNRNKWRLSTVFLAVSL